MHSADVKCITVHYEPPQWRDAQRGTRHDIEHTAIKNPFSPSSEILSCLEFYMLATVRMACLGCFWWVDFILRKGFTENGNAVIWGLKSRVSVSKNAGRVGRNHSPRGLLILPRVCKPVFIVSIKSHSLSTEGRAEASLYWKVCTKTIVSPPYYKSEGYSL